MILISANAAEAALVAQDLLADGMSDIALLTGSPSDWSTAGLEIEATPDTPTDANRIDFQSFTAGRHDGDEAASRQYLKWEIELVDQLDADERAVFRV